MGNDQILALSFFVIMALLALALRRRRRWRGSGTSHGTASWMLEKTMRAAGYFGKVGLIVGRTFAGALIRIPDYVHVLLIAGTGGGKGVGIIIPNLLSYRRGSIVCFDTKGDLIKTTGARRAASGDRVINLCPFPREGGAIPPGADRLNPLDTIPRDSLMLVDSARAMAEALVVRQGTEMEPHWNDKAVQIITAVLVLVLLTFDDDERNLVSVQKIISDPDLLRAASKKLQDLGGVPGTLGSQIKTIYEGANSSSLTREGGSVLSVTTRHLSFLDSELVARAVSDSTFDPRCLVRPGTTVFIGIPPDQLEAQRGLLRCWISTLVRVIGAAGDEMDSEVLFLLDEASALGSLSAVEEALVRGRSAGVRMLLAYQSDSQVKAAFPAKPTLLYDNCATQVYLGAPSSLETADRLSKTLGDFTQVLETYNENESHSSSSSSSGSGQPGGSISRSHGHSYNYSESGRALKRPEELLTQSRDRVIVLQSGMAPILANRVKWYADPEFNGTASRRHAPMQFPKLPQIECDVFKPMWANPSRESIIVRLIAAAILVLILWQMVTHP